MGTLGRGKSHSFFIVTIQSSVNMASVCYMITFHQSLCGGENGEGYLVSLIAHILPVSLALFG